MHETTITRRHALATLGGTLMAVAAAAILPTPSPSLSRAATLPAPADLLAGWEPTLTDSAHRAAVFDVAGALTVRLGVASERSTSAARPRAPRSSAWLGSPTPRSATASSPSGATRPPTRSSAMPCACSCTSCGRRRNARPDRASQTGRWGTADRLHAERAPGYLPGALS